MWFHVRVGRYGYRESDTMVWGVPAKRRERNSTQEFNTLYVGIRSEGVYISIKLYSILIMKMNCLLTPFLPTVQQGYDDDDDDGNGR